MMNPNFNQNQSIMILGVKDLKYSFLAERIARYYPYLESNIYSFNDDEYEDAYDCAKKLGNFSIFYISEIIPVETIKNYLNNLGSFFLQKGYDYHYISVSNKENSTLTDMMILRDSKYLGHINIDSFNKNENYFLCHINKISSMISNSIKSKLISEQVEDAILDHINSSNYYHPFQLSIKLINFLGEFNILNEYDINNSYLLTLLYYSQVTNPSFLYNFSILSDYSKSYNLESYLKEKIEPERLDGLGVLERFVRSILLMSGCKDIREFDDLVARMGTIPRHLQKYPLDIIVKRKNEINELFIKNKRVLIG